AAADSQGIHLDERVGVEQRDALRVLTGCGGRRGQSRLSTSETPNSSSAGGERGADFPRISKSLQDVSVIVFPEGDDLITDGGGDQEINQHRKPPDKGAHQARRFL